MNPQNAPRLTRVNLWDRLRSDLHATWRSLRKNPAFTLLAVGSLGLGIGANTLIFSIVNTVLLRPLVYPDAGRLYTARTSSPGARSGGDFPVSGAEVAEWRKYCNSCESIVLLYATGVNLGGVGTPRRIEALSVSGPLLQMLGSGVQAGRPFTEAEQQAGSNNNAVLISDGLWRNAFGADPRAIGKRVIWNHTPVEIVGVLPPDFRFPKAEQMGALFRLPSQIDILRPLGVDPALLGAAFNFGAIVKLKPNASPELAVAEMNRTIEDRSRPPEQQFRVRLFPLKEKMTASVRGPFWLLLGAAGALLLIVCVNLGGLLMVRAAARQREWAVRLALGAGRWDLVRQTLTESLVLAFSGGMLGALGALAGVRLLPHLSAAALPRLDEISLDWRVWAVAFLVSGAAGVLCSLAPSWRLFHADPEPALRTSSRRASESRGERHARHWLIACEAALSMALAAATGLLIVSFMRVITVDKGFNAERALTFQLSLEGQYSGERRIEFHQELLRKIRSLPGVSSAGLISHLPLQGEAAVIQLRPIGGAISRAPAQADYRFISPSYFLAAGTRILAGREFAEADLGRRVAILSEGAARRAFPNESPLGHRIEDPVHASASLEIVGVVSDVKAGGLESEAPLVVYLPFSQVLLGSASYVVRTSGNAAALFSSIRAAASEVARDVPIYRMRPMSEIVDEAVAPRRLMTLLCAAFAAAGVFLTCLGVFGVVSYDVSMRTAEIGVRMALGATQRRIVAFVMAGSLRPVLLGLCVGVIGALALGRVLASLLYGVTAHDPVVLGAIFALLGAVALAAAHWPARRAARIEPMEALRSE